jgi:hypothetical protein
MTRVGYERPLMDFSTTDYFALWNLYLTSKICPVNLPAIFEKSLETFESCEVLGDKEVRSAR